MMKTSALLAVLALGVLLSACRKNRNESTVYFAPTPCNDHFETRVDGQCVLKPGFSRFGGMVYGKGAGYWISKSSCPCVDSVLIGFKVDTLAPGQYYFTLTRQLYGKKDEGFGIDVMGTGAQSPNYFPDAAKGDSVSFNLLTSCYDWINPLSTPRAQFVGRFNPEMTLLTGRFIKRGDFEGPPTGETCEGIVFRKVD